MATEDKVAPYEILIRFPKAGGGEPSGAHFQQARTVVIDGETVKEWEPGVYIDGRWHPNHLLPLALVSGDDDQKTLSSVMGEAATMALLEVSRLELEKAAMQRRIEFLEQALEAYQTRS